MAQQQQQQPPPKQQVQLVSVTSSLCDEHMNCMVSKQVVCKQEREADPVVHADVLAQGEIETTRVWCGLYQGLCCSDARFAFTEDDQGGIGKHALNVPPQVHTSSLPQAMPSEPLSIQQIAAALRSAGLAHVKRCCPCCSYR